MPLECDERMPIKCPVCDAQIQNKSALEMHLRYKHVDLNKEQVKQTSEWSTVLDGELW